MSRLALGERQVAELAALARLPTPAHVAEFCKQALEALATGTRKATLKHAAAALGLEVEVVESSIKALSSLFLDAAKAGASQAQLLSALGEVAITEDAKRAVAEFYATHNTAVALREGITAGLAASAAAGRALSGALADGVGSGGAGVLLPSSGASAALPEYRGLDWRLEVEVARRNLHDAQLPQFVLRLDTLTPGPASASGSSAAPAAAATSQLLFTADFDALKRASQAVDEAAAELSTAHARRVQRYVH